MLLAFALLTHPTHAAEDLPPIPPPSDDAAVWYLTALLQLAEERAYADDPDEAEMLLTETRRDVFDLEKTGPMIDHIQESLDWARRGAMLERCTWPTTLEEDGIYATLPHLSKMRNLSRVLVVSAMVHEARGDLAGSTDDCMTAWRLASHAAADQTVIGILVQYSIQAMVIDSLAGQIDQYDRVGLKMLRDRFKQSPDRVLMSTGIAVERAAVVWLRRVYTEKGLVGVNELLNEIEKLMEPMVAVMPSNEEAQPEPQEPDDGPKVKAARKIEIKTAEEFERMMTEWHAAYVEAYEICELPETEFENAWGAFHKRLRQISAKNSNPLISMFMPALGAARRSEVRLQARANMLDAMIAYRLGGQEAFEKVIDPLTGDPYDFEVTDEGVVLSTPFKWVQQDDQPWSQTFPAACAQPLQ